MLAVVVEPRTPLLSPGEIIDGRYRISYRIADGGMSTVYLAEHMLIKRRLAIKLMRPELASDLRVLRMFMNEAKTAGTLGHPNIVEATDMGFHRGGIPYIVYEYVEGALLTEEIYRVGGMSDKRALRIAHQVASALDAAHAADIVHLDLKADNVMLTDEDGVPDRVKVLDFGIARLMTPEGDQTQRHLITGTPAYMSPEQVTDPENVDHRADIYALGVLLYEMLTARRPFANGNAQILLWRLCHEEPEPIEGVKSSVVELVRKLMAKDREARPQSMREVMSEIEAVQATMTVEVPIYDDVSVEPLVRKRRPRFGFVALALLAAGGAFGLRYAEQRVAMSTDDAALVALQGDAKRIAADLDAQQRAVQLRADSIASTPLLGSAMQTDAATIADLVHDGRLPLSARRDERIEVGRLWSDGTVSGPVLTAKSGEVVVRAAIDTSAMRALVAQDAATASLTGVGTLVAGAPASEAVTVPVSPGVSLSATIAPAPKGGATLHLASNVGLGFAALLMCGFGLTVVRRTA